MYVLFIIGSIFLLLAGHFFRVKRWEMFIETYEKPLRNTLFQALGWGYLINQIIPFKMGEVVRAWYAGKRMKSGKALGFSTVIIDRYLDILAVGMIAGILSITISDSGYRSMFSSYIITALTLVVLTGVGLLLRGYIKRVIRFIASVFNSSIEIKILKFAWALVNNFKDFVRHISVVKLLVNTICMWILYIASYILLAAGISGITNNGKSEWTEVFSFLFFFRGLTESSLMRVINTDISARYITYAVLASSVASSLCLIAVSFFEKNVPRHSEEIIDYVNLFPHLSEDERLSFLEDYFSNKNKAYVETYIRINQGISIIRDYSAGSSAATMLCLDKDTTFFRKYAFGEAGNKLYDQIEWMENNAEYIKLPQIIRKEKTDIYCYYDMPYYSDAIGLFEFAHSMPIDDSWNIIESVINSLSNTIYKITDRPADTRTIAQYIHEKVRDNLSIIKESQYIRPLMKYEYVVINGLKYPNLNFYEKYLSETYLEETFVNDRYATIHGDLTIENIICQRDDNGYKYYIIDPNTGNIHNSPNLDYAKLLQSIHGGYEFLMMSEHVKIEENQIKFAYTKSSVYEKLYSKMLSYMHAHMEESQIKSIYFHEMIHWIRLMPYKIKKDGKRSLIFFAGMLMVMHDVIGIYGEKNDKEKTVSYM